MKIIFLARALGYGGAERQLVTLAVGLRRRGHRVGVAVLYGGGALEDELRRADVSLWDLGKRGRWDAAGFLVRLVRLVRRERPDVLHGYLLFQNLLTLPLARLAGRRARAVWGLRDSRAVTARYDQLERCLFRCASRLSRFADLIIVNSRAGMTDAAAAGFDAGRMTVIANGIETGRFTPDVTARSRVRNEWGVEEREVLVGLVSRLDPIKGHREFIRAAALVGRGQRDLRFVCVGDGPNAYREELSTLAAAEGLADRLLFSGARGDMPAVYNALDVLVSASRGEGFSNVIAEAMACGVACVVTDVGDSAWVVGNAGEVIRPGDPDALAEALERACARTHVQSGAGSRARRRVLENFSVAALVARTEAALAALTLNRNEK